MKKGTLVVEGFFGGNLMSLWSVEILSCLLHRCWSLVLIESVPDLFSLGCIFLPIITISTWQNDAWAEAKQIVCWTYPILPPWAVLIWNLLTPFAPVRLLNIKTEMQGITLHYLEVCILNISIFLITLGTNFWKFQSLGRIWVNVLVYIQLEEFGIQRSKSFFCWFRPTEDSNGFHL